MFREGLCPMPNKPPKPFVPSVQFPTVNVPALPGEKIARVGKLIQGTSRPALASNRLQEAISAVDNATRQFDALERSSIGSAVTASERFGSVTKAVNEMPTFTPSIAKFVEDFRHTHDRMFQPHGGLGEALRRQSELMSGLVPAGRPLNELGGAWRSIADFAGRSLVDRTSLSSRIAAQFAVLDPSAILPSMPDASVLGFSHLVRLERANAEFHPFGEEVTNLYDEELGDPVEFDEDDTPEERREAARRSGFNDELTAFVFGQQTAAITVAGFEFTSLATLPLGTDDTHGVASYHAAADPILKRLEREAREFIVATLRGLAGEKWVKQRVPHAMRGRWHERRKAAVDAGQPECPIILYADFMDLCTLIVKADNWRDAFERHFQTSTDVQVAFERIVPVRNALSHTRPVLDSDVTMLAVEAFRLLRAMGRQ